MAVVSPLVAVKVTVDGASALDAPMDSTEATAAGKVHKLGSSISG